MESSEALQARLALELRAVDLAVEVNTVPDAVTAWEAGEIRVPRHAASYLRWRVAGLERAKALESSGLPECSWIHDFENRQVPDSANAKARGFNELLDHAKTCETCLAREAYIAARFPPMPRAPLRGWLAIVAPIAEQIDRLPKWARPAATGAVLFVAYSLFKLIFLLPAILRDPIRGSLFALEGISISASLGAVLGLLYGQYRRIRDGRAARGVA